MSEFQLATVPLDVVAVMVLGYYARHDAPPVTYTEWTNGGAPPHPAKLQSADTRWWEMSPSGDFFDVRWFGAKMVRRTKINNAGAVVIDTTDMEALENAISCTLPPAISGNQSGIRTVYLPVGELVVTSTIFLRGATLRGSGVLSTTITLDQNNGVCIWMDGGAGLVPPFAITGGGLKSLSIWSASGTNGFIGVQLSGNAIMQPDEAVFEDIKISGGGTWSYPMYMNGSARAAIGSTLKGLRKVTIRNAFFGNALVRSFEAVSVGDLTIYSGGSFASSLPGITPSLEFLIGGTLAAPSNTVQLIGCNIQDKVYVYHTEGIVLSGKILYPFFSTGAVGCAFYGIHPTGTASSGYFNLPVPPNPPTGNQKYVATL